MWLKFPSYVIKRVQGQAAPESQPLPVWRKCPVDHRGSLLDILGWVAPPLFGEVIAGGPPLVGWPRAVVILHFSVSSTGL